MLLFPLSGTLSLFYENQPASMHWQRKLARTLSPPIQTGDLRTPEPEISHKALLRAAGATEVAQGGGPEPGL